MRIESKVTKVEALFLKVALYIFCAFLFLLFRMSFKHIIEFYAYR